jgi:hypothetical protein
MNIGFSLIPLLAAAIVLTSCSSTPAEPSPQEKRNNYDKCILDYIADNVTTSTTGMNAVKAEAPFQCRHHLG